MALTFSVTILEVLNCFIYLLSKAQFDIWKLDVKKILFSKFFQGLTHIFKQSLIDW